MKDKIVRSICYFSPVINTGIVSKLESIENILKENGYQIQTKRVCIPSSDYKSLEIFGENNILTSLGTIDYATANERFLELMQSKNLNFNIDLTDVSIGLEHVDFIFKIIRTNPNKTFDFTYVFNNKSSSPFFPSANYEKEGYSIGYQATNLAEGCKDIQEWLSKTKEMWMETTDIIVHEDNFLGIDSSIAPLGEGSSSLLNFLNSLGVSINQSVLNPIWTIFTNFIKTENPMPIGLNGLMLPCLEDFQLAREYEKGNFSLERNILISLMSGLGIDTYPIAVNESQEKLLPVLKLVQSLSRKYDKPLSIRFVSDGVAKVGESTNFKNQYLSDVVVQAI